jgi:hypothetical protein
MNFMSYLLFLCSVTSLRSGGDLDDWLFTGLLGPGSTLLLRTGSLLGFINREASWATEDLLTLAETLVGGVLLASGRDWSGHWGDCLFDIHFESPSYSCLTYNTKIQSVILLVSSAKIKTDPR